MYPAHQLAEYFLPGNFDERILQERMESLRIFWYTIRQYKL